MYRIKKAVILVMLVVCPVMAAAQTCLTNTIPASTPTERFAINSDGTVTDSRTGLMWQQCRVGQSGVGCRGEGKIYPLKSALKYVQNLNASGGFAGYTDWRLPNIKELNSIVEEQCSNPAINLMVFSSFRSGTVWSSSPYASSGYEVWVVDFGAGNTYSFAKNFSNDVLLVR